MTEIRSVSCGKEHTLALSAAGQLFSFGLGSRGQLGNGSLDSYHDPTPVDALQSVDIIAIAAGGWHSMAISGSGDMYSWGWNESGQLGVGCAEEDSLNETTSDQVTAESDTTCRRPMFSFLPNIVDFKEDVDVVSVSCGSRHSAAVTADLCIWTWGWNGYGQLGHGDKKDRHSPKKIECIDRTHVQECDVLCNAWNTMFRFTSM